MPNTRATGHPAPASSRPWRTGLLDDGGVRRNGGVGNKAAYLVAEGGRFNGRSVKGIGQLQAQVSGAHQRA